MPPAPFDLPRIIGHRGAAAVAPENTLAGLRAAAALGATWVEFDVMLTRDDVPVLFHDETLRRTTGRPGRLAEITLPEVQALDAGAWFAPGFAGEPVPTLEDALALLADLGLNSNVEIKPSRGRDAATAERTVDLIARCWAGPAPGPLVSSFSRTCLEVAARQAPELPRGLLAKTLPVDWLAAAEGFGCRTVHLAGDRLSPDSARRIKDAGYGLAVYTVNDPARAQTLIGWGVDAIITDTPGVIAAALA